VGETRTLIGWRSGCSSNGRRCRIPLSSPRIPGARTPDYRRRSASLGQLMAPRHPG